MSLVKINGNTLEIGPRKSVVWVIFAIIHIIIVSLGIYSFSIQKYTKPVPIYFILLFGFSFVVMYGISIHTLITNLFRVTKVKVSRDNLSIVTSFSFQNRMQLNPSEITDLNSEIQSGLLHVLYRTNGKYKVSILAKGKSNLIYCDLEKSDADKILGFIKDFQVCDATNSRHNNK